MNTEKMGQKKEEDRTSSSSSEDEEKTETNTESGKGFGTALFELFEALKERNERRELIYDTITTLTNVIVFAAEKHKNQRRKDSLKTPYINHPLRVLQIINESGVGDESLRYAAVLHDTLEDTDTTTDEILGLFSENDDFGAQVLLLVEAVTDDKSLDKVLRKKLQVANSKLCTNTKVNTLKLADKYSNLSDILVTPPLTWTEEEITGYCKWSFRIVENILKRFEKDTKEFKYFSEKFKTLFEKLNITECTESDLKTYYQHIDKSE